MAELQTVSLAIGRHAHIFRYRDTPLGRALLLNSMWQKEIEQPDVWTSLDTALIWNIVAARAIGNVMERAKP